MNGVWRETDRERYLLTIKELGNLTSTIKNLKKGQRAYLEGPYGAFTLPDDDDSLFFVVGDIGITPVMSMLRTMRDKEDRRKVTRPKNIGRTGHLDVKLIDLVRSQQVDLFQSLVKLGPEHPLGDRHRRSIRVNVNQFDHPVRIPTVRCGGELNCDSSVKMYRVLPTFHFTLRLRIESERLLEQNPRTSLSARHQKSESLQIV